MQGLAGELPLAEGVKGVFDVVRSAEQEPPACTENIQIALRECGARTEGTDR